MIKRLPGYHFHQAKFHSSRRNREVDVVVIHYTAGRGNEDSLARFFANGNRQASAHFGVGRTGRTLQMVDLDRSAWHTGVAKFMAKGQVGWRSVGIEICNSGWSNIDKLPQTRIFNGTHRNPECNKKQWEKYTWEQIEAVNELLIQLKNEIPTLKYVTGHEDIRNRFVVDSKGSKTDPGPAFPWHVLKLNSIGLEQQHFSYRDKVWYNTPENGMPTH
jgi:N-acetyl-anhydromuramyl-L-alanine amidase AmpD